jgi:hypothetical protein
MTDREGLMTMEEAIAMLTNKSVPSAKIAEFIGTGKAIESTVDLYALQKDDLAQMFGAVGRVLYGHMSSRARGQPPSFKVSTTQSEMPSKQCFTIPKFQLPKWNGSTDTAAPHCDKIVAALQSSGHLSEEGTVYAPEFDALCIQLFLSTVPDAVQDAAMLQPLDVRSSFSRLLSWFKATRGSSELVHTFRLFEDLLRVGAASESSTSLLSPQEIAIKTEDVITAIAAKCSFKAKGEDGRQFSVPLDLRKVQTAFTRATDLQTHFVEGLPAAFFLLHAVGLPELRAEFLTDPVRLCWERARTTATNLSLAKGLDPSLPAGNLGYSRDFGSETALYTRGKGRGPGTPRYMNGASEDEDDEGGSQFEGRGVRKKDRGPLCWRCNQYGHVKAECKNPPKKAAYYVVQGMNEYEDEVTPVFRLAGEELASDRR